jgi:hypothetical protein
LTNLKTVSFSIITRHHAVNYTDVRLLVITIITMATTFGTV